MFFHSKILELNENEIRALPHSFGSLSKVQRINLDMNPLQSPPILLMQEGIEPVLKYCAARAKMVEKLTKMLLDEGKVVYSVLLCGRSICYFKC